MPRLELYAFRYRDPRSGKWVGARYVATSEEIAERYAGMGDHRARRGPQRRPGGALLHAAREPDAKRRVAA